MAKMIQALIVLLPAILTSATAEAQTTSTPKKFRQFQITGTYSNISMPKETGDYMGEEIHIFPSSTGFTAMVEMTSPADGGDAILVPATNNGNDIDLVFPSSNPFGCQSLHARVSATQLEGDLMCGTQKHHEIWKRRHSFWD